MRIGEWLIHHAIAGETCIESALAIQRKSGGMLGDILLSHKSITPLQWRSALNAQGIPTLDDELLWSADLSLLEEKELPLYSDKRFVPLRDGNTLYIATPSPSPALQEWCDAHYGTHCQLRLITKRDLNHFLLRHFHGALDHHARERLHTLSPHISAKRSITAEQRNGLLCFLFIITCCFLFAPRGTWYLAVIASTLFYLATLAFKLTLLVTSPPSFRKQVLWQDAAVRLEEKDLPIYSLLVPLYRESPKILKQLLEAIDRLDYPKTRLDVWLITEEDDPETRERLYALRPADYYHILAVPPSHPRTKPKACNVALPLLRGTYVSIYDAEDIPEADQLRLSVAAFAHSSKRVACLQTPLNYYNRTENLLTKLFAIEYSALFRLFLPALRRLRIPIPLGGTSNHLRLDVLREVQGWDAYNVTEDADLGIRLAYYGYTTELLPSLTREEATLTLNAWLRQRSRWIKDYIQTWLVYMRNPLDLFKQLGPQGFFGFQLFVGAPAITFLLAPLFWSLSLLMLSGLAPALHLPDWVMACCAITLVTGFALQWATAVIATRREGWSGMQTAQLAYPVYWILHSLACLKALWQLVFRPHYWEKTQHGQSRIFKNMQSNG